MNKFIKLYFFTIILVFLAFDLSAQSFPKFKAYIGGKVGGEIEVGELLAQTGVGGLRWIADNHWEWMAIDSFRIIVVRDTTVILVKKNTSQAFDEEVIAGFKKLVSKDKVLVYEIYGRNYDNKVIYLDPLEFILK